MFSTCLNTASAIRYTLHQLRFLFAGVKENINCQDFDLSLRLRFVTPEKNVKLDSFYLISTIFPNHFRVKKSNVWHIHVWRLKCYYTCQKWRLDWNSILNTVESNDFLRGFSHILQLNRFFVESKKKVIRLKIDVSSILLVLINHLKLLYNNVFLLMWAT